ncbi:MAG: PilZ domain-containing protein [Candidatus Omnitrophota bacterium]
MTIKHDSQERRRDPRLGIFESLPIKFRIKKSGWLFSLVSKKTGAVQNMSVGGMFLELPFLKDKNAVRIMKGQAQLILEIKASRTRKPIRIKARVLRLEKGGATHKPMYVAGLSFEDIKEKDREEILHQLVSICLQSGSRLKA